MHYNQLIQRLKQGKPLYIKTAEGLISHVEWKPPSSIELQAANAILQLQNSCVHLQNTVLNNQRTIENLLEENEKLRGLQKCAPDG